MPPGGNGNGNHNNGRRPFLRSNFSGPPSYRRGFNPYLYGGSRRRTPSWLIRSHLTQPVKKNKLAWFWVLVGLVTALFIGILGVSLLAIIAPVGIGTAIYTERYNSLSLDKEYALTFENTRIYDRNGTLLFEQTPEEGLREYVTIDKIPQVLIDATTAAEDPTFFDNQGVDPYALVRAAYINLSGRGSSGASTITQQVARALYLPPQQRNEISVDRKVDEIILATKLNDTFSKDKILEKYLNNIYYGNLAYGIQAAALGYFGKEAKDIDLAEASMLAGLPQAPSDYDPTKDFDLARRRQKIVLDLMVKYNRITQPQADAAYRVDLQSRLIDRRKKAAFIQAPHFVNYVLQQLQGELASSQLAEIGLTPDDFKQGGYDIYTTIDLNMVNRAQEVVKANVDELKKRKASNAALVALQPNTGEILAMVGSTDFNDPNQGQYNAAIARRQPGSALKPITYAVAMEKGWTAATVLADVRTEFPGAGTTPYVPKDFDGTTRGPVPLRNALGSSLNIPAVKALQFDGLDTFFNKAKDMGVTFQYGPERYGLTITLGGGEVRLLDLTGAYGVFDNLGDKVDTVSILKIVKRGETIYEFSPDKVKRKNVLSPQVSYIITNILSDNNARLLAFARNNPLVLDRPAAAKTGTSEDFTDSWTVGYTPDLVVGVWVGNNNNKPMDGVAGSVGGGIVWNSFMNAVYKEPKLTDIIKQGGQLQTDFVRPADIVEATICIDSGLLPNAACPQRRKELFPKASVPTKVSDMHRFVKVPKASAPPAVGPGTPTAAVPSLSGSAFQKSQYYCIPDDSWPPDQLEERLFYVYPPELQQWALSVGRIPPPTQPCDTYVPPTPTPTPSPSPSPTVDVSLTPDPNLTPGATTTPGAGLPGITPAPTSSNPGTPAPPTPTPAPPVQSTPAPTPTSVPRPTAPPGTPKS